jgi:hypothetical protein
MISVYRITHDISGDALKVQQEKIIAIDLSYTRVFNLCLESLNKMENLTIRSFNINDGKILAHIHTSALIQISSWCYYLTDEVTFQIEQINSDHTHILISSHPGVPFLLIDYGRNVKNLERISIFLKNQWGPHHSYIIGDDEFCPVCNKKN